MTTEAINGSKKSAKITPYLIFTCILASTGGLMYGYDLVVAGGVSVMNDFLQRFYPIVYMHKINAKPNNYCKYDNQAFQLFSSSLYIAALTATFFASIVTRKYGRKVSIQIAGLLFIVGTVLSSGAGNLVMLIGGRVLLGCGLGFSNQAIPLYLSELAPPQWRGALTMLFCLNANIGIFGGNIVNYIASTFHPWGWRLSLGVAGLPAILLILSSLFLVETPTSLIQRGQYEHAKWVLCKVRGTTDIDAEYNDLVEASKTALHVKSPFRNLLKRKNRPQLTFAIAFPFFQQVAGNDAVLFYGPFLFLLAGFRDTSSLYAAVILGATALVTCVIAMLVVDKLGRRILLLGGTFGMALVMVIIGTIFAVYLPTNSSQNLPHSVGVAEIALVCAFVIAFSCSWGPLSWLIPSEIYPQDIRSAGQSVTVCVNMFFKFAIAQTFLSMLCHFKYGVFFFFAGWAVVMGVVVLLLFPETKGIALDDMVGIWQKHWYWKWFSEETRAEAQASTPRFI